MDPRTYGKESEREERERRREEEWQEKQPTFPTPAATEAANEEVFGASAAATTSTRTTLAAQGPSATTPMPASDKQAQAVVEASQRAELMIHLKTVINDLLNIQQAGQGGEYNALVEGMIAGPQVHDRVEKAVDQKCDQKGWPMSVRRAADRVQIGHLTLDVLNERLKQHSDAAVKADLEKAAERVKRRNFVEFQHNQHAEQILKANFFPANTIPKGMRRDQVISFDAEWARVARPRKGNTFVIAVDSLDALAQHEEVNNFYFNSGRVDDNEDYLPYLYIRLKPAYWQVDKLEVRMSCIPRGTVGIRVFNDSFFFNASTSSVPQQFYRVERTHLGQEAGMTGKGIAYMPILSDTDSAPETPPVRPTAVGPAPPPLVKIPRAPSVPGVRAGGTYLNPHWYQVAGQKFTECAPDAPHGSATLGTLDTTVHTTRVTPMVRGGTSTDSDFPGKHPNVELARDPKVRVFSSDDEDPPAKRQKVKQPRPKSHQDDSPSSDEANTESTGSGNGNGNGGSSSEGSQRTSRDQ